MATISDSAIDIEDVLFHGNYGDGVGGLSLGTCDGDLHRAVFSQNRATGLHIGGGTIHASDLTIKYNHPGLHLSGDGDFDIHDVLVADNSENYGGNVALWGVSGAVLRRLTITDGYGWGGSGVYALESSFELIDSAITDNIAEDYGGGLWLEDSSVSLSDVTISGNEAYFERGGGIFAVDSDIEMDAVLVHQNLSRDGGGLALSGGTLSATDTRFTENTAEGFGASGGQGGGMYLISTEASVSSTTFGDNSAALGGGFYVSDSQVEVAACTFSDNADDDTYLLDTATAYAWESPTSFTCDAAACE